MYTDIIIGAPPNTRTVLDAGTRCLRRVAAQPGVQVHPAPDITQARLPGLIGLIGLRERAPGDLTRMGEECGLRHFEGRSYRSRHHHVTLVSVARAFRLLGSLRSGNFRACGKRREKMQIFSPGAG